MATETIFPNGILLNLYKHIDAAKLDLNALRDQFVKLDLKVAFGNFDRLRFYPISDFTDFRKQSSTGHLWIGGRRDIMLFALSDGESQRSFQFSYDPKDVNNNDESCKDVLPWKIKILDHDGNEATRRFLCVSMLYLSGLVKNLGMPYKILIEKCKKAITKIVQKVNENRGKDSEIIYEVFGSLNSAELAILWGTDQFDEIQYIVDQLRYLQLELPNAQRFRVFFSSYTIAAFHSPDPKLEGLRGGSMIQFSTSTKITDFNSSRQDALEYIEKVKPSAKDSASYETPYSCSGEYDYIYNVSAAALSSLQRDYSDDDPCKQYQTNWHGIFSDSKDEFKKHFSATTTQLYYREPDIVGVAAALKDELSSLLTIEVETDDLDSNYEKQVEAWKGPPQVIKGRNGDTIRKKYLNYTEHLKEIISGPSVKYRGLAGSNFLYNLELLLCDYVQCVSTMPNNQWARDFEYQFSSALAVLEETLPSDTELLQSEASTDFFSALDDYIARSSEIITLLQQTIHHLAEAGKLFFEEPNSHSEATGQYDLVIHTYYGIIKSVLREIGKNSSHLLQAPTTLVPILQFSEDPIIKSTLYVDEMNLSKKLVRIRIPYDACGEIGLYAPLLIHEVYHYVPPVNRKARNQIFAVILLTELTIVMLKSILDNLKMRYQELNNDKDFSAANIRQICTDFRRLLCNRLLEKDFVNHIPTPFGDSANWKSFSDGLLFWIANDAEIPVQVPTFASCYKPVLIETYQVLKKQYKHLKKNDGRKRLVDVLSKSIMPDPDTEPDVQFLCRLANGSGQIFENINQALRELLPDFAMVHFTQLKDISDYLLLLAIVIDKQYARSGEARKKGFLEFRIGFIADYILFKFQGNMDSLPDKLAEARDPFRQKYNAYRCLGVSDSAPQQDKDYTKEADCWYNIFEDFLLQYKESCHCYRPLLRRLAEEQFAPGMREEREKVWEALLPPFTALTESKDQHFRKELDIIRAFQPQWFLENLQFPQHPSRPSGYTAIKPITSDEQFNQSERSDFWVKALHGVEVAVAISAATDLLQEYHRRVFGRQSNPKLWFRGVKSAKYPILPSIMVHFMDRDQTCPNGKNHVGTLVEYQRALLEEFKYQADGAREFINASSYTTADYIALMQHYSKPTCYLDWSEDAYSSLYFALEKEIKEASEIIKEKPKDKKSEDEKKIEEAQEPEKPKEPQDAVLYLFDPKLYNLARLRLINKFQGKINEQFRKDKMKRGLSVQQSGPLDEAVCQDFAEAKRVEEDLQNHRLTDVNVPNISMRYTAKRYGIHSMELIYAEGMKEAALRDNSVQTPADVKAATFSKITTLRGDLWNLPRAIYTSRLNPRIRIQSGNFLAYSIFSRPVCCEKEQIDNKRSACLEYKREHPETAPFNYLSLKEIQNYYLEEFQDGLPFLMEVIIPEGEKKPLAEMLYHAGINKYRIYPELDNLSLS